MQNNRNDITRRISSSTLAALLAGTMYMPMQAHEINPPPKTRTAQTAIYIPDDPPRSIEDLRKFKAYKDFDPGGYQFKLFKTMPTDAELVPIRKFDPASFKKPDRPICLTAVHWSGRPEAKYDDPHFIRTAHRNKNWKDAGYHFLISRDGTIWTMRDMEWESSAQRENNHYALAICVNASQTMPITKAQVASLKSLCQAFNMAYKGKMFFVGHRDVNLIGRPDNKNITQCPGFDYKKILGLDENFKMPVKPKPIAPCLKPGMS